LARLGERGLSFCKIIGDSGTIILAIEVNSRSPLDGLGKNMHLYGKMRNISVFGALEATTGYYTSLNSASEAEMWEVGSRQVARNDCV
jgi:hypothetical protein